jgi:hypothetical protein
MEEEKNKAPAPAVVPTPRPTPAVVPTPRATPAAPRPVFGPPRPPGVPPIPSFGYRQAQVRDNMMAAVNNSIAEMELLPDGSLQMPAPDFDEVAGVSDAFLVTLLTTPALQETFHGIWDSGHGLATQEQEEEEDDDDEEFVLGMN